MTEHVKIYGVTPRIQYTADGTLTEYEFPFAIFSTSDIDVYFGDTLQDTSTYTVSEACHSDGGSVTFESAPASGTIITIVRNLSIERTSDFQEGSTLRAKVLNDELDYQIACTQQIAENLNRSMVLPPYATDNDLDLTLPMPSAGKAIVWNADGTNLENSSVAVNDLESTLNGYKTAAQSAASTATSQAQTATTQAQTATVQAGIATTKASEAASSVNQLNGMRTNCITEIPQDIKLELSNGTLTLKSGSKVYVPNGSSTFDSVFIVNDVSLSGTVGAADIMILICVSKNGSSMFTRPLSNCVSGAGATTTSGFAYDITANKINWYNSGGTKQEGDYSLPICIIKSDANGSISLVEQVFNGFGYIGSTLFTLPGVKGLIPNGRNADGTLKNTSFTLSNVRITTYTGTYKNTPYVIATTGNGAGNYAYDKINNAIYNENTIYNDRFIACSFNMSSNKITSITPKSPFSSADYNDVVKYTECALINKWNMPDYSAAVNVGLGVDYTAPSNGYISSHVGNSAGEYSVKIDGVSVIEHCSSGSPYNDTVIVPIAKGSVVHSYYISGSLKFYPCIGG